MASMECPICEQRSRQFYCRDCLKQHLLSFRLQSSHLIQERDSAISSGQKSLSSVVQPARLQRADLRECEERVREVWDGLEGVRKDNDRLSSRIRSLRETLSSRRRTLAIASTTIIPPQYPAQSSSSTPPNPHSRSSVSPPSLSTSPSTPSRPSLLAQRRMSSNARSSAPILINKSREPAPSASTPPSALASTSTSPQNRPISYLSRLNSQLPGTSAHSYSPPPPPSPVSGLNAPGNPILAQQITEAESNLARLSETIARARAGLVQELIEVFSVVEVGGRPPVGGKAGTKGEWTIGGLVLPVPGDIRRYPPDHINAVLTHTIHFLTLLSFYLGIKLPFEIIWSRSDISPSHTPGSTSAHPHPTDPILRGGAYGLLGVGTPWIGAIKGGEGGGWARWSAKHPLHVSASSRPQSTSSPSPTSPTSTLSKHKHSKTSSTAAPSLEAPDAVDLADSTFIASPHSNLTTSASGMSFTTALAMLLYDVCYLAYTQAVDIPLAQAGEVLGNLWAVCCSPELGKKSHATHPHIPYPTPPSFPLDFAQLLQATTSNPSRANARVRGITGTGNNGKGRVYSRDPKTGRRMNEIKEKEDTIFEEDGWDLV